VNKAFIKIKNSWFVVFCLAAIGIILACNTWLLCYGHATFNDFLRIPMIGWILIFANVSAALVLWVVKRHGGKKSAGNTCGVCNAALKDPWVYCPNCGNEYQH
jgi:hypothetical protein